MILSRSLTRCAVSSLVRLAGSTIFEAALFLPLEVFQALLLVVVVLGDLDRDLDLGVLQDADVTDADALPTESANSNGSTSNEPERSTVCHVCHVMLPGRGRERGQRIHRNFVWVAVTCTTGCV